MRKTYAARGSAAPIKRWPCANCGFSSPSVLELTAHVRSKHGADAGEQRAMARYSKATKEFHRGDTERVSE